MQQYLLAINQMHIDFDFPAPALGHDVLLARRAFGNEEGALTLRRSLDPTAPQLPAGADALQKIKTCLVLVEAALKLATLPLKMHKAVRACLDDQSPMRQESMLRALHLDVEHSLNAAKEHTLKSVDAVGGATKNDPRKLPHVVLLAMGADGRNRALWHYYEAYNTKRPPHGQRALMDLDKDSYCFGLYEALLALLTRAEVKGCPEMGSVRLLRDFVASWYGLAEWVFGVCIVGTVSRCLCSVFPES